MYFDFNLHIDLYCNESILEKQDINLPSKLWWHLHTSV